MKIAILHEMLVKLGGAEKVVKTMMDIFPEADLFTLMYDEKKMSLEFPKTRINKQVFKLKSHKVYNLVKNQRLALLFMASSVEALDFSGYDVVLTSSSGFAHGAITKPETNFIVYYHSPSRYLWDWTNEYKKQIGWDSGVKSYILNKVFNKLRIWDLAASSRPDVIIAASINVQRRISKYYRRDSEIIYPCVETDRFRKEIDLTDVTEKYGNDYYLITSALTEYKNVDMAIGQFNQMPEKKLLIIGEGAYKKNLEQIAGSNIEFLGYKDGDDLVAFTRGCKGFIFAGEEDFGIIPVEVMAAGKAILAFRKGGLLETMLEGKTGEFFEDKDGVDFIEKFREFDKNIDSNKYLASDCLKQASKFSQEQFCQSLKKIVYK